MICSNCAQRIPAGVAPASVRVGAHDYPMCSLRCLCRWASRITLADAERFVTPATEPAPRPQVAATASAISSESRARKERSPSTAPAPDRAAKIRAFWAALTPAERARRTATARAAAAKKRAEAA